ncbi:hypothetical protein FE783_08045 [Paenibacillus mesophilus]|uniref:hypothetical protein n=1 Tax=Paenibacillus mesophilus TaxID=2582849 RepID=UPI00110D321D|nr:hypothetical protein [Paenibacillus mesophilus]TMV50636.1 hypothetical protein FE783_08045 [Paenibacillus mesophilus]
MIVNNFEINEENVDGQMVYLPNMMDWKKLIGDNPIIDGEYLLPPNSESTKKILLRNLEILCRYPEMSVVFCRQYPTRRRWSFINLIKLKEGKLQRFQLEHLTCESCGWNGYSANPTIPDLYWGLPSEKAVLDAAWKIPKVNCPYCGRGLPRYAIWVENK